MAPRVELLVAAAEAYLEQWSKETRMPEQTILLLHGFASSGDSSKGQFIGRELSRYPKVRFHAFDFNPSPKDFEYVTVTGMINRVRQYWLDHDLDGASIIGSSMGALVGLNYAHRFGRVSKMLLLAPALAYGELVGEPERQRWERSGTMPVLHYAFEREIPVSYDLHRDGLGYCEPVPPPAPVVIVHGRRDDVIPVGKSQDYAARYPDQVRLLEADSDHRLSDQLPLIWEQVESFLLV